MAEFRSTRRAGTIKVLFALAAPLAVGVLAGGAEPASAAGLPTRVNVSTANVAANNTSGRVAVSSNGRYVAFESRASNLIANDTNGKQDIFVRDRISKTTTRVSLTNAGAQISADSFLPTVSADGRYVTFQTAAANVVTGDTNGAVDVFMRDRTANTTTRVSVGANASQLVAGGYQGAVSATGQFVTFTSKATGAAIGDTSADPDVFIHDRTARTTKVVSLAPNGTSIAETAAYSAPNRDGRYVAFTTVSGATTQVVRIYLRDRQSNTTTLLSGNGDLRSNFPPAITPTGAFVAFATVESLAGDDVNGYADVYVYDRAAKRTRRVSIDQDGGLPNNVSFFPSLSDNGRFIAFQSSATDIAVGDTNNEADVFLHDRTAGTTSRINTLPDGTAANAFSGSPQISGDGSIVSYASGATNLVSNDTNGRPDIFAWQGPPVVPDTSAIGPSGFWPSATPSWELSSTVPFSKFRCKFDSAAWANCGAGVTRTLTQGAHTLLFRAVGPDNTADQTPFAVSIFIDSVKPNTTITDGPTIELPTRPFVLSSDETNVTYECRFDAAAYAPCTSPVDASHLTGPHTFDAIAIDRAGNRDTSAASRSFDTTPSTTPPDTSLSGPTGLIADNTPTFTFSSATGTGFECSLDNGAFATCTSPVTTGPLSDAAHTFAVRATIGSLVDASPASKNFTVDTAPPETTITNGPPAVTTTRTPKFQFTSTEAGGSFVCSVDGAITPNCVSGFATDALIDGEHTFTVVAIDAAGNADPSPASLTFTVDTAAPDTAITGGPAGVTADSTPSFTFSSLDANATFQCRIDTDVLDDCTSPFTAAELADGAHTFGVRATDAFGNVSATQTTRSFTVDTTGPVVTINSGPLGATNDNTPSWQFSSSEASSTFVCGVDSGSPVSCTSPFTSTQLADGPHTFSVTGTDAVGNPGPARTRSIVVDTQAPDTTLTVTPPAVGNNPTPSFEFTSPDATAGFECKIDMLAAGPCASPFTVTAPLGEGNHSFSVWARDPVGNVDATPATFNFTLDLTVGDTVLTKGAGSDPRINEYIFEFTTTDETATFECQWNGGGYAPCTSPYNTGVLADREHLFEVRTRDAAGNVDPTPASQSFNVEARPPETTITGGPGAITSDNTPTFSFVSDEPPPNTNFHFQCRLSTTTTWSPCNSPYTLAALPDGTYTFLVRAIDRVINIDPTPATYEFTVDTTP